MPSLEMPSQGSFVRIHIYVLYAYISYVQITCVHISYTRISCASSLHAQREAPCFGVGSLRT